MNGSTDVAPFAFGLLMFGALMARPTGFLARRWLAENTGYVETVRAQLLRGVGIVLGDIGPMREYMRVRRVRGQSITLGLVFSIGCSFVAAAVVLLVGS